MNTAVIAIVAAVIKEAVDLGPTIIKLANDAKPFAEKIVETLTGGREVSQEELDKLLTDVRALSSQLQAPYVGHDPESKTSA